MVNQFDILALGAKNLVQSNPWGNSTFSRYNILVGAVLSKTSTSVVARKVSGNPYFAPEIVLANANIYYTLQYPGWQFNGSRYLIRVHVSRDPNVTKR